MIRAVVFDFDGLILDTETPELVAWQEIYREHGCELPLDLWADCIGRPDGYFDPYAHLAQLSGCSVDREALKTRRRARSREMLLQQDVMPGVREYIADAQRLGIALAVASSSTSKWVGGHLERLGLRHAFAGITCAEHTPRHKPDPAPYLCAVESLKVTPAEAIALEDSPNGIAAAKAAGLFTVAVPNHVTRTLDVSQADLRVESLLAIPLEQLLAHIAQQRP